MRRKAQSWPNAFDLTGLDRVRTIRQFDEAYTAPHHGFAGASDYYFKASAMRVIDRVRIPALILTAEDDPFVPGDQFREAPVADNLHITTRVEAHGGHCGFIGVPLQHEYWAESTAARFLERAFQENS
jgi:predicted alpha/beta-fold hydrolase